MDLTAEHEDFDNPCPDQAPQKLIGLGWRNPVSAIVLAKVAVTTAVKALIGGDKRKGWTVGNGLRQSKAQEQIIFLNNLHCAVIYRGLWFLMFWVETS
jgi:hypothetical protein